MDAMYVGIDVSKDRLDVHVRPSGEAFAVARDGKGLEDAGRAAAHLSPTLVAVEATGGFETIVAAALAGAGCPWWWSTRRRFATSRKPSASVPRPIRSTPRSSPALPRR